MDARSGSVADAVTRVFTSAPDWVRRISAFCGTVKLGVAGQRVLDAGTIGEADARALPRREQEADVVARRPVVALEPDVAVDLPGL